MSTLGDEIAVEVMGWRRNDVHPGYWMVTRQFEDGSGSVIDRLPRKQWNPETDPADAIRAIEKATKNGQWTSRRLPDGSYIVMGIAVRGSLEKSPSIHAPTFAEAVLRLALAVVRRGK